MRDHVKAYADGPAASPASEQKVEKFRVDTAPNGNQSLIHQGQNRHERRANRTMQKHHFKALVRDLTTKAKRIEAAAKAKGVDLTSGSSDTATFEEAVAATLAPQAPETVPSE